MKTKAPDANGLPHRWQRYPKYKPSGVEWLGEVPEGWELSRLRFLCSITTGSKNTEDSDPTAKYPFFVRADTVERLSTYSFDEEAILTAGDGVGVAKVFHYYNGKFDAHQRVYVLTKFKGVQAPFLYHYFKQNLADEVLKLSAKSTVDSLRLPMLQNFPVLIPSLPEQYSIATFLDRETARIDVLIEKKERQIELLQEKRAALISHAVTKGLDPSVPMKESGVKWMGMVPEHWEIKRIIRVKSQKRNAISMGPFGSDIKVDNFVDTGIPVIQGSNLTSYCINEENFNFITEEKANELDFASVYPNDIIITHRGTIGQVSLIPENSKFQRYLISQSQIKITFNSKAVFASFANYFLNSHSGQIAIFLNRAQTAIPAIGQPVTSVKAIQILVPPMSEQEKIADYIDQQNIGIDRIISRIESSIITLQEYRSALISAAVTGKIDVRQEAKA